MPTLTLMTMCDGIAETLGEATAINVAHSYDELLEGIVDYPLLQVYPNDGTVDPTGTRERTTFRSDSGQVVKHSVYTFNVDLYACPRRHIGEDMQALVEAIDSVETVLFAQPSCNAFGVTGIQAFSWTWSRVVFIYGDSQLPYAGARFVITVHVF